MSSMRELQDALLHGGKHEIETVLETMKKRELAGTGGQHDDYRFKFMDQHVNEGTGMMPLHVACMSGKRASVEAMLEMHADLTGIDNKGRTPLHCAAEGQNVEAIAPLIKALESKNWAGKCLGFRDRRHLTPLHLACGAPEVMRVMIHCKGARANLWDTPGLLRRVVLFPQSAECLHALLDDVSDMNLLQSILNEKEPGSGKTILVAACEHGCLETCQLLIKLGADPTIVDMDEQNALHWACMLEHTELRDWLRSTSFQDALDSQCDASGRTPQDWDTQNEFELSSPALPSNDASPSTQHAHEPSSHESPASPPMPPHSASIDPSSPDSVNLQCSFKSSKKGVAWRQDRIELDEAMNQQMEQLTRMLANDGELKDQDDTDNIDDLNDKKKHETQ